MITPKLLEKKMWNNYVEITGRVTTAGEQIELPSGDTLTRFRVVIPREKPTTKATVDTIDCVSFKAGVSKKVMKLAESEVVELQGQLRRRFWQTGTGVASRMEVEVTSVSVVRDSPDS